MLRAEDAIVTDGNAGDAQLAMLQSEDTMVKDGNSVTMQSLLQSTRVRGEPIQSAVAVILARPDGALSRQYYHFLFDDALMFFLWHRQIWGLDRPLTVLLPRDTTFAKHFASLFEDVHVCLVDQVLPQMPASAAIRASGKGKGPPLPPPDPLPAGVASVILPRVGAAWGPFPNHFEDAIQMFREHVLARSAAVPHPGALTCVLRRQFNVAGARNSGRDFEQHGAGRRYIVNSEELQVTLRDATAATGLIYEEPEFEVLPILDQVSVFARSWIVIAQHGSALSNVIWMPRGAWVIELGSLTPLCSFETLCEVSGVKWTSCSVPGPDSGGLTVAMPELLVKLDACLRDLHDNSLFSFSDPKVIDE